MKSAVRQSRSLRRSIEALEQRIAPAMLVGLDQNQHLIIFDSASPGVTTQVTVSGLLAGDALVGIDVRPATGGLYGLAIHPNGPGTSTGHVYLINPTTGAATLSATLAADPTDLTNPFTNLSTPIGTSFGVDFNPQVGALRVIGSSGQNLRVNVDTGLVNTDTDLNGAAANVSGAAYTNSFAGATSTQLYDLDPTTDALYNQAPPNNGTLTAPKPLGVDATGVGGFDILSHRTAAGVVTETAYAALTVGGTTGLYSIDLGTGAATSVGPVDVGTQPLVGLTALTGAPAATAYTINAANNLLKFNTATPNNVTVIGAVSIGAGENIIGFDFRPANGVLYAVTKDASNVGRLYSVDPGSGAATLLANLSADPADTVDGNPSYTTLNGTKFGVDFNPVADRLRIVSDAGENLRVNVGTGLVFTDGTLNGSVASVEGAAYTNSFLSTTSTTLYDIDTVNDTLHIQSPPNNGTLTAVGTGLHVGDVTHVSGFDIRSNGEAYATLTVGGVDSLYSINLTSGEATLVGNVGAGAATHGLALAPVGTFQLSAASYTVAENGGFVTITVTRTGGSDGAASVVLTPSNGTAVGGPPLTLGVDFLNSPLVVNFAAGDSVSKTVQIPIANDTIVEGVEQFFVTLSDPTGAATVNNLAKTASVAIADNDVNLYAIDGTNHLLTLSSASPGTAQTLATVIGFQSSDETLIGIDFRPATGLLYGLTKNVAGEGNLYVINTTTGVATFSAKLAANPGDTLDGNASYTSLSGTNFGIDFNPQVDKLRVVSDSGENLRIDVDTGLVFTNLALNPAGPTVSGAAYLNNFAGAASTTLYDIDTTNDTLVKQETPNSGTLTSALPLGVDATAVGGFDIVSARSADGTVTHFAYATLTVGGTTGLYSIDLTTGQATSVGVVGTGTPLLGLAAALPAPSAKAFSIVNNTLLSFNTATPSVTTAVGAISGLTPGETIIGYDFRPADGALYAVTKDAASAAHLYVIDPTTGAAGTSVALTADPADTTDAFATLSGTAFDVDFNPVANKLRIVSNTGQNLRVDVDSHLVNTDTPLSGAATGATGAAYQNNVAAATATTLFEIDPVTKSLYTLADPNSGAVTLVGALGVDASAVSGFDIRSNGEAFASLTVNGVAGLYSINLGTGAATFIGAIGTGAASTGFAVAPAGTVQFSSPTYSVSEDGGTATLTLTRTGGADGTTTVFVNTANGTAGSGDFTGGPRAITFGPGVTTQTISFPIINDNVYEGNETFTSTLSNPVGGAGLGANASTTVTITDNEAVPTIAIGDFTATEGLSGGKTFTFNVTLSALTQANVTFDYKTVDGTAQAADNDYIVVPTTQLVIPAGQTTGQITVTVNGDVRFEPTETFTVQLSNASANAAIADGSGLGTIQNDDANSISAKMLTYTDIDGDLVTVKTTVGTLSASNFTFAPAGKGLQLQTIDLSSPTFLNSNLIITAKRTALGGDGFANVGYLNAAGNTLGTVSFSGDLGQVDANAIRALGVVSLGKLGVSTQGAGGSLVSTFTANLPTFIVKTDIVDATVVAQNFTAVTVFGNVIGGAGDHSGSIEATGRIGALNIVGTLRGGADAESGSVIAKSIGALKIREIDGGRIFVSGNIVGATATTANIRSALALGSLTVSAGVQNANILVGYDRNGAPVNADVQTGAISITGGWTGSNLAVGVKAGADGFYGSDTGAVIGTNNGAVVARIASITVKAQAYGSINNTTDRFGFVAEQIGAFVIGTTRLTLGSAATAPKDNLTIGFTDDLFVREY